MITTAQKPQPQIFSEHHRQWTVARDARQRLYAGRPRVVLPETITAASVRDAEPVAFDALSNLTMKVILAEVMAICPHEKHDVFNRIVGRKRWRVQWRQAVMWAMRKHTRRSLNQIGAHLGGFDHTTVLHAVNAIDLAIFEGRVDWIVTPSGIRIPLRNLKEWI